MSRPGAPVARVSGMVALGVRLGLLVLRLLARTWRYRLDDRAGIGQMVEPQQPVVWAVWHNRLLPLPELWSRIMRHRAGSVLVSRSKDGAILARCIELMGGIAVRGSSSRGGAAALTELKGIIERKIDVWVTPDGPRGPRYIFHPGSVWLAKATGVPLVPVTVEVSRAWRMRSWDGFMVPKPFARISVTFHEPPQFSAAMDEETLKREQETVREMMLAHTVEQ